MLAPFEYSASFGQKKLKFSVQSVLSSLLHLYTDRLFHCYILDESILGVSGLFCCFYSTFDRKSC